MAYALENVRSYDYIPTQESDQPQTIQTQFTATKKPRKQSSWVWKHVTLNPTDENKCYCNYCSTWYTCPRGRGIGHIARQLQKCIAAYNKDDNTNLKQSKLHVSSSRLVN